MSGEQAIFNLEIKKKSGLSLNPDIHHSKVFSSGYIDIRKRIFVFEDYFVFLFHSFMGSTVNKTKLVQWNLRNFVKS